MIQATEEKIEKAVEKGVMKAIRKIFQEREERFLLGRIAESGGGFDFLLREPDIYSEKDICGKVK